MNNCKHAGSIDSTLKICRCDINYPTQSAEDIRGSYMKEFGKPFIVHGPFCIFELENNIEVCKCYEKQS